MKFGTRRSTSAIRFRRPVKWHKTVRCSISSASNHHLAHYHSSPAAVNPASLTLATVDSRSAITKLGHIHEVDASKLAVR